MQAGRRGAVRVRIALVTLLAGLWAASLATAAPTGDELLEPDAAFRPSARLVGGAAGGQASAIAVEYRIASGYYLYRDRMRFEVIPAGLPITAPEFPPAEPIDDPFLGKTAIYRDRVTVILPLAASVAEPARFNVRVTAQGCAEDRFCFSPFRQEVPIGAPGRGP